jgi:ribosome assembly protein SQT1
MVNHVKVLEKYDLSSVKTMFSGAAPLGAETAIALQEQHKTWKIRQGYGKLFGLS